MEREASILKELRDAVLTYDHGRARRAAEKVLEAGIDPLKALEEGLASGLREVGDRFEKGEIYIPHIMLAAKAMKVGFEVLEPRIKELYGDVEAAGVVVLGTIEGDIHDIGKSIVALMLEASGFRVYDIGRDVPVDTFIEKAKEVEADVIGVSALMTTTMIGQERLIKRLKELGFYGRFKVIIGGAAVTDEWAEKIGADAYGEDAIDAVKKVKALLGCVK